jgi:O-antigen ligase
MAAVGATYAEARPRSWGPAWPLYALFVALPIWWALGAAYFIWPLLTAPLLLMLLYRRGNVRIPPRFGVWLLFLGWVLLASVQLDDAMSGALFTYRLSLYVSATLLFLYVYNAPRDRLPDVVVVRVLALFWALVVIGGFVGVFLPYFSFSTPVEALLPASFLQDKTAYYFVHPAMSEVMTFLGYPVGRPKTLFAYSNQWGAATALLTPFALAALSMSRPGGPERRALVLLLVLSIVPITVSLNRGLWLSLGIGLIYIAVRLARQGNVRALGIGLAAVIAIAALVAVTPLGGLISDRLTSEENSNKTRGTVYEATIEEVKKSPLVGYGSPRLSGFDKNLPELGTQGQFFTIMFSYGVPAVLLFAGWFIYSFWRSLPRGSPTRFFANASLLILLLELPYYNHMPTSLHVVMVAAALAWRDLRDPAVQPARRLPARVRQLEPSAV